MRIALQVYLIEKIGWRLAGLLPRLSVRLDGGRCVVGAAAKAEPRSLGIGPFQLDFFAVENPDFMDIASAFAQFIDRHFLVDQPSRHHQHVDGDADAPPSRTPIIISVHAAVLPTLPHHIPSTA